MSGNKVSDRLHSFVLKNVKRPLFPTMTFIVYYGMTEIGQYNNLKIVKEVDFGFYLDGGEEGEILLPRKYAKEDTSIGNTIKVFIYKDSKDRIIAVTDKPYAIVGEFAFLKVVDVNKTGAFLDWGLPKDLLLPYAEQDSSIMTGSSYVVKIIFDTKSQRIIASQKLHKYFISDTAELKKEEKKELLIYEKTELGFRAVIDNAYTGMLYKNEIFRPIEIGLRLKGYIKNIRDDGKIDLTLLQIGERAVQAAADSILAALKSQEGVIHIGDNSSPEEIAELFKISKKSFKRAIGQLYKKQLISIEEKRIILR